MAVVNRSNEEGEKEWPVATPYNLDADTYIAGLVAELAPRIAELVLGTVQHASHSLVSTELQREIAKKLQDICSRTKTMRMRTEMRRDMINTFS